MSRNVLIYVRDILENMKDAEEFVRGMEFEQFSGDKKTINAALRSVEIIGEASKHVPDPVRDRYPDIPWKEMAGMRDKVTHAYFRVDLEAVWVVIAERIPKLRPAIEQVAADLETTQE
jgi:uncharacterized protein with HEPN domain